jgi:diguanylate cyclase (GGDEF)-like protein
MHGGMTTAEALQAIFSPYVNIKAGDCRLETHLNSIGKPAAEPTSKYPNLLGRLGKMTAHRDTILLEQSLLKTLAPMLGVSDCSLFRANDDGQIIASIHHHRSKVIDENGAHRYINRMEENSQVTQLEPHVEGLLRNVRILSKASHQINPQGFTTAYPIFGAKNLLGVFLFQRETELSPIEDASVRGVLEVFSNYFSLLDESQRDHLTGLQNRHALERFIERLWAVMPQTRSHSESTDDRRQTNESGFWLAVIDIDHFKRVNDTFGHVIGDEILLLVSRLLLSNMRASDHVFRYGGEEFVAVIQAEDDEAALRMLERLRESVQNHMFPQVGNVTISIGFSRTQASLLPDEVLRSADKAMYHSKQEGRNQTHQYETLVRDGVFKSVTYGDADLF